MSTQPAPRTDNAATPDQRPEWRALEKHQARLAKLSLKSLFDKDPKRFEAMHVAAEGLLLDYSKNRIDRDALAGLMDLARASDIETWRDRMFDGFPVNATENRAVLHTALRRPASDTVMVDGENIMPFIHQVFGQMRDFSDAVISGRWTGHTGKAIEAIVNIGIGGSDLGPYMVCEALRPYKTRLAMYFVSNVDGAHLFETLKACDPATTLFVIASKTFTTQETMANADSARRWLLKALGDNDATKKHFVALSTNAEAVQAFGIAAGSMLPFREWVGGRYSLWSAIGLSISLAVGYENFAQLLAGGHAMDRHFCEAPLERNMPVLLAMIGIWHRNFWHYDCLAILPYSQYFHRFSAFLQQLDMESNGKSVDRQDRRVSYETGPIVFGEPGTNGQHAFYQLIHQGTTIIPCDFIGIVQQDHDLPEHQTILLANLVAQTQALMDGRDIAASSNNLQKVFEGNRPSNTLLLERLDPYHLGQLIALYEHKIFVQGIVWNINSFDQWGVELGKALAQNTLGALAGQNLPGADSSTLGLVAALRSGR